MHKKKSRKRIAVLGIGIGIAAATLISSSVVAANPQPSFIPPTASWLTTVNYFRAMAGVGPVVEDASMSAGAVQHSCYMLYNGISHDETPGQPGYTPEGDVAGNSGNVAVSSQIGTSARSHIELWMSGPFHAIGVLRPNLQSTGFGKCDLSSTPVWHSGATLDVIRGLASAPRPATPIVFPGNGTTTSLNRFVTESPSPMTYCGWTGSAGLPLIAMMPEAATNPTASLIGPNGQPIEVCVLSAANTSGVAMQILQGDNAVIVVPRTVLADGTYSVAVGTASNGVNWSFTVDQAAVAGITPVGVAQPTSSPTGFAPLAPARIVDTREAQGTSRLAAGTVSRIQVTGQGNVPADAKAVLANVTVTNPAGSGFLTMWNCSARPEVSTVNFSIGETVANTATIPLDSSGGLCAFSTVSSDIVVDVGGYYSASASGRYAPVSPVRLMDSRNGVGAPARLAGGQTVELAVVGGNGIPTNATAVALNVTGVSPSLNAFITTFPCGTIPSTSSLNPAAGKITPNLVMAQVSARGTVCFFTNTDIDLVVDVVGYVSSSATNRFTPSAPFRFTDTRDNFRTEVNAGQNGMALAAGQTMVVQIAGVRNVPAAARAISANLTVVEATDRGFVTAWPCGDLPTASNVNYEVSAAVANAAELPLSSSGAICIYSSSSAQVIIDINGWWS